MPPVEEILSLAEAQALVLGRVRPLAAETIPLTEAAGRFLAEPARAVVDLPPFQNSAMDGYALRAGDTPGELPVVHRVAAGTPAPRALEAGEAMGIATGGLVPEGADAVIQHELVVENDNNISVSIAVVRGANIREQDATSRQALSSPARAFGSARRRSARSRLRGSPRSSARAARGWPY